MALATSPNTLNPSIMRPSTTITRALARDHFVSITELVELFLQEADTLELLKCQRVCRKWKEIIDASDVLQEKLFFRPVEHCEETSPLVEMNPILGTHFAPVLQLLEDDALPSHALRTQNYLYADLKPLPWAHDGTNAEAPSRLAFARDCASWRRMHISQPPIKRLDWWNSWSCSERGSNGNPLISGKGHEYSNEALTLGLLWDVIEARLLRGCSVQTTIFRAGCETLEDPTASSYEKGWEQRYATRPVGRGYSSRAPRVRVQSCHVWPGAGPSMYQEFHMPQAVWKIQDDIPPALDTGDKRRMYETYAQNGWMWLALDCLRDSDVEVASKTWRWSKSDGFRGIQLRRSDCLGPGGNRREALRRRREGLALLGN